MKWFVLLSITALTTACLNQAPQHNGGSDYVKVAVKERFRPEYHFTPEANWMNDPNGMVYYAGEYHLFYQYHPESTVWGPMHWGHSVSPDMVNWKHLPIALYPDELGTIFSGSAVIDWNNTSGFGSKENPPMVAIFTYHNMELEKAGRDDFQTQGLAYSLDKGRTWTKYSNNPIIANPGKFVFRDPKVSWHAPSQKWVMVITEGNHIGFYSSNDLKDWDKLSEFGDQWGEHNGVWECPDLIRVNIEGTNEYKYVLIVSINPGAPNGGSGTQYFIGDFDGTTFMLDADTQKSLMPIPDSFPDGYVFEDFEGDLSNWTVSGDAFGNNPATGSFSGQQEVTGFVGNGLLNSFYKGDGETGKLSSKAFNIDQPFINFYAGGGDHQGENAVNLIIDGKVVKSTTGKDTERLQIFSWDVTEFMGLVANIEIIDNVKGGWGHILADQFVFAEEAATRSVKPSMWVDYGTDNYAGVTFSDVPDTDGRILFMGWMNNWDYANQIPTGKWRSSMTIPRSLSLKSTQAGLRLFSAPVAELNNIGQPVSEKQNLIVTDSATLFAGDELRNGANRLKLDLDNSSAKVITITYSNAQDEKVTISLDTVSKQLLIDRTQSGIIDFEPRFSGVQKGTINTDFSTLKFDIFYDNASVEVFMNEGELAMSAQVFPTQAYDRITVSVDGSITINSAQLSTLAAVIK
jgi:fructan beta-fructosidase